MSRRIFSICMVLGFLLLALLALPKTQALAQASTPTLTATPGCNPPPQTPSTWVSSSATSVNTGDQVVVTVSTNVGAATFGLSIIDTATGLAQSQTDPIFTPSRPASQTPSSGTTLAKWTLTAVRPGIVFFRGSASGEVQFCSGGHIGFTFGAASGNSVNVTVNGSPITPVATFTPTATATITKTPTRTNTPTRTATGPTPTRTKTPTAMITPTQSSGTCSPVTSTIKIPFVFDGAGTFCWQTSSLGGFINSWSTTSVSLNGVNITNMWVGSGSYPAKINGFYYISYNSAVTWGHFEAKP